jgi:hypothetical protein
MALTTYAELLTKIQTYFDDTSSIVTDEDQDWVTLAESRIHYGSGLPGTPFYSPPLRIRAMEQPFTIRLEAAQAGGTSGGSANAQTTTHDTAPTVALGLTISFTAGFTNTGATTLQPTGGSAVDIRKGVNNDALEAGDIVLGAAYTVYYDGTFYKLMPGPGSAPLPARFLGFKHIWDDGTTERPLDFFATQHMMGLKGINNTASPAKGLSIIGDDLRVIPPPDSTRFLKGVYYRRFDALSSELNELFRRNPNIYLYGCLLEGALYLGDDAGATKWHGLYSAACQSLIRQDQSDRYGPGPLIMRVPTHV